VTERIPMKEAHQRLRPIVDRVRVTGKPIVLTYWGDDHVAVVPVSMIEGANEAEPSTEPVGPVPE